MLKYSTFFAVFVNFIVCAQDNSTTSIQNAPIQVTIPAKPKENVLSLEQQGFKLLIINNKEVYRKEQNGIIVEFIPKEN